MSERIKESDLFLPALYIIYVNEKANTTDIKNALEELFKPQGDDAAILSGRKDTKFSQIVRNLMGSHYNSNGMAQHTKKENGKFTLTTKGKKIVNKNLIQLQKLFENSSFDYDEIIQLSSLIFEDRHKSEKILIYSENDRISEGKCSKKEIIVKERSRKLRKAAIEYYTIDNRIICAACGFDFYEKYGELGEGYIQIHHETPIFQYSDHGEEEFIIDAIKKMKPVCANCHCMLHRNNSKILTIDELKELIK